MTCGISLINYREELWVYIRLTSVASVNMSPRVKAIRHAGDDGLGQMTDATESVSDGLVRVSGTESAECRRFGRIVGGRSPENGIIRRQFKINTSMIDHELGQKPISM